MLFEKHLTEAGKTYSQHFMFAFYASGILIYAAFTAIVHAIVPSLFPFLSENIILVLAKKVRKNRLKRKLYHRARISKIILFVEKDDQGYYVVHNNIKWQQSNYYGPIKLWWIKQGDIVNLVDGDGFGGRWIVVQHNKIKEDWLRQR